MKTYNQERENQLKQEKNNCKGEINALGREIEYLESIRKKESTTKTKPPSAKPSARGGKSARGNQDQNGTHTEAVPQQNDEMRFNDSAAGEDHHEEEEAINQPTEETNKEDQINEGREESHQNITDETNNNEQKVAYVE